MEFVKDKCKKIYQKFFHAFKGILSGLRYDFSIQIQYFFMIIACSLAWFLHFSYIEWIIILLLCGGVIALEYINSAIEEVCDVITKEKHASIKKIKDLAAGAVLILSITALIIGICMVIHHI